MTIRLSLFLAVLLAIIVTVALRFAHAGREAGSIWEPIAVERGEAVAWLRETGTLAPRDPVIIPAPFDGKLQWVIEDATWVQQGDPLFILADADELKKVADERQQLEEATQDRELAALKLEQADETEERKVRTAGDDLVLEQARYRILTEPAKGGMELVELDRQLRPLAAVTSEIQERFVTVRDAWQVKQDAYLDRLDAWQQHQDALLSLENRLDELDATAREAVAKPQEAAKRKRREAMGTEAGGEPEPESAPADPLAARAAAMTERQQLMALTAGLRDQLAAARSARDAAAGPRAAAAAELADAEAAERDLRIRIEIEKRRLPATQLALDLRLAEATASEADRRLVEGRAALTAQVLSQAAFEDLVASAEQARAQVETTRERLAIAAQPAGPELLAEAAARLARARQAAAQAQAVRDRNLEIQRQEIAMLDARIARLSATLAVRARRFPSTIEQELAARERERTLRPAEAERLAADIAQLQLDLAKARANPPNVLTAPVSGLVKVRREGDRQKLAGDDAWQADPMCEVYPPQNMEVVVRVNEFNVPLLRQGQRVTLEIPALGRLPRTGVISQVAGVGRDKNELLGRKGASGVTQYEVRIVLDPGADGRDGDLRQGMTALVAIEIERVADALILPREAVAYRPEGLAVRRRPDGAWEPVAGRLVGDRQVVITAGLQEKELVYVRRFARR
jgi:multidrug resistance efflux pump